MSKLTISVWTKENENFYKKELRNLKPRYSMLGYSFERLLKYISEELYWEGITEDSVTTICIACKEQQWENRIPRPGSN